MDVHTRDRRFTPRGARQGTRGRMERNMLTLLPKRLIVYILDILYFQQGRQRNENIRILVLSRHRNVAGMDADAGVDPYSDGAGSSASTYHHHHNREGQCYYEFTVYLRTVRTYFLRT